MTTGPEAPASDSTTGVDEESLATALGTVDTESTQRLGTLQLVYQARQSRLSRTAASIATQQGADSAAAVAAQAAVAAAKTTAGRIGAVQQQVSTETPAVAATGWILHGRVYTAELEPAVAYCIFLVDAQRAFYTPAGFSYTDSTGYFLLTYSGPAAGEPADSAEAPPALYPEVTNPKGKPVYLAATQFAPVAGAATYQAIALPAGEAPIGDPPRAVRGTSSPPAASASAKAAPAKAAPAKAAPAKAAPRPAAATRRRKPTTGS